MKLKKKIAIIALVLLILIQFIRIDKTQPPVDPSLDFFSNIDSDKETVMLLKNACKDCHSFESEYPSYTNIQPIGWWIKGHIKSGVKKLNFSEWNKYSSEEKNHHLHESIEVLEENRMPLKSYTWLHPEAKLNEGQKQKLIALLNAAKNN